MGRLRLAARDTFDLSQEMERIKGLLRETWWLWTIFFVAIAALSITVSGLFLFMYPALTVVCAYFAFVRYDEHGNPKEEL